MTVVVAAVAATAEVAVEWIKIINSYKYLQQPPFLSAAIVFLTTTKGFKAYLTKKLWVILSNLFTFEPSKTKPICIEAVDKPYFKLTFDYTYTGVFDRSCF